MPIRSRTTDQNWSLKIEAGVRHQSWLARGPHQNKKCALLAPFTGITEEKMSDFLVPASLSVLDRDLMDFGISKLQRE